MRWKKIIKNITTLFIVYILLGGYTINELVRGETLTKEIKVQIKSIYKKAESEKLDTELNSSHQYGLSHSRIKYQDIENAEVADKLKNTFSENVQSVNFNVNLLNDNICQNIENNLASKYILVVKDEPDVLIEVTIEKATVSHFGSPFIVETVVYNGFINEKMVFSGEFKQNYKFPSFGLIKTPEQIGKILAKKILKEIKKLQDSK